jgi:hypothetical protein
VNRTIPAWQVTLGTVIILPGADRFEPHRVVAVGLNDRIVTLQCEDGRGVAVGEDVGVLVEEK